MRKWLWRSAILLAVLATAYIALPWYSATQLVEAAQREDVEKLQRYVDFPTLQDNIKQRLQDELRSSLGGDVPKEFDGLFTAGSEMILGPLVERFVSPGGIADLIQGRRDWRELEKMLAGKATAPSRSQSTAQPNATTPDSSGGQSDPHSGEQPHRHRWHLSGWHFTGLNTVVAQATSNEDDTTVRLYMQRQGLRWRLVDLALIEKPSPEN
ncbi:MULTISPECIES: DUF2939 domain-containing protein [Microbulbifer]|uniref:DUF2939 domain-containing protein n=1 Tax=Microbulbifer celer TaxID=435905 RepID=A0ABW3U8I7_9GAMM|nr:MULTISPECIES: DUF2939 domain-containing protein [Microbulbifer]